MANVSQMELDQKSSNNVPIHGVVMVKKWVEENAQEHYLQAAKIEPAQPTMKRLTASMKDLEMIEEN